MSSALFHDSQQYAQFISSLSYKISNLLCIILCSLSFIGIELQAIDLQSRIHMKSIIKDPWH